MGKNYVKEFWREGTPVDFLLVGGAFGAAVAELVSPSGMERIIDTLNVMDMGFLESAAQDYRAQATALWEGISPHGEELGFIDQAQYWVGWNQAIHGGIGGAALGAVLYGARVALGRPGQAYSSRNE